MSSELLSPAAFGSASLACKLTCQELAGVGCSSFGKEPFFFFFILLLLLLLLLFCLLLPLPLGAAHSYGRLLSPAESLKKTSLIVCLFVCFSFFFSFCSTSNNTCEGCGLKKDAHCVFFFLAIAGGSGARGALMQHPPIPTLPKRNTTHQAAARRNRSSSVSF